MQHIRQKELLVRFIKAGSDKKSDIVNAEKAQYISGLDFTAVLLQAVNSAVKGDLKAIQNLFPHLLAVDAKQEEKEQKISSLKQDDMEILNSFFNHKGKNNGI